MRMFGFGDATRDAVTASRVDDINRTLNKDHANAAEILRTLADIYEHALLDPGENVLDCLEIAIAMEDRT